MSYEVNYYHVSLCLSVECCLLNFASALIHPLQLPFTSQNSCSVTHIEVWKTIQVSIFLISLLCFTQFLDLSMLVYTWVFFPWFNSFIICSFDYTTCTVSKNHGFFPFLCFLNLFGVFYVAVIFFSIASLVLTNLN